MIREDAIKTLKELRRETNDSWYEEVYNMAINALEADCKTEPQKKCHRDEEYACHLYPNEGVCNNCKLWYEDEPQTMRDENYIYAYDKTHGEWYPIQEIDRPCDNCQEWDCYGCDYKQVKRSKE